MRDESYGVKVQEVKSKDQETKRAFQGNKHQENHVTLL
jgi:hypothetical protein